MPARNQLCAWFFPTYPQPEPFPAAGSAPRFPHARPVQIDDLQAAPRASQGGAFGMFTIEPADADASAGSSSAASTSGRRASAAASSWVALPMWRALAMARQPVGLMLKDCAAVQAVLAGSKAKVRARGA